MHASNIAGTASHTEPTIVAISGSEVEPTFNDTICTSKFAPAPTNYTNLASGVEIATTAAGPISDFKLASDIAALYPGSASDIVPVYVVAGSAAVGWEGHPPETLL